MSITQSSVRTHVKQNTIIVVPELDRLGWVDKVTLRMSIWLIQRTVNRSQSHSERLIKQHTDNQVLQRELRSLRWLPPR